MWVGLGLSKPTQALHQHGSILSLISLLYGGDNEQGQHHKVHWPRD